MLRRYWPPTSKRRACLSERADAHRVHQHGEDVLVLHHRLAQALEHRRRLVRMARVELAQAPELALLFFLGGADQLELRRYRVAVRVAEGVDADDRVGAVVLLVLVNHGFFLDLAALVSGLHRAEHAAP
jgi:hypothetical protein